VFFDVSPPNASGEHVQPAQTGLHQVLHLHVKGGPHNLPVIFDKRHRMFEVQPAKLGPTGKPVVLNAR
jgi:hypothetical protein